MAATAPRWTRLEHDERREQILACARRLFSERHHGSVSTSEIAREAGVARGLLHHYFGTKRDLYLAAVRSMVRVPPPPMPAEVAGRPREAILADSLDGWLDMVERNRAMWIATVGAQGIGSDPELDAILEEAREGAVSRIIAVLGHDPDAAPAPLRAAVRCYGGFAEAATLEWLHRGRLTREQVRALLVPTLLNLIDTATEVAASRPRPGPTPTRSEDR